MPLTTYIPDMSQYLNPSGLLNELRSMVRYNSNDISLTFHFLRMCIYGFSYRSILTTVICLYIEYGLFKYGQQIIMWMVAKTLMKQGGAAFAPFVKPDINWRDYKMTKEAVEYDSDGNPLGSSDSEEEADNFLVLGKTVPNPDGIENLETEEVEGVEEKVIDLTQDENNEKSKDV